MQSIFKPQFIYHKNTKKKRMFVRKCIVYSTILLLGIFHFVVCLTYERQLGLLIAFPMFFQLVLLYCGIQELESLNRVLLGFSTSSLYSRKIKLSRIIRSIWFQGLWKIFAEEEKGPQDAKKEIKGSFSWWVYTKQRLLRIKTSERVLVSVILLPYEFHFLLASTVMRFLFLP